MKPEQIGSGVLVMLKNQYFMFCATHVFLKFENYRLLAGIGDGSKTGEIPGERYSTGKLESPLEYIYDATVFHIQSDISKALKNVVITLNDFDFSMANETRPVYMAEGFRVKKSNTAGNSVIFKRECYPSIEVQSQDYLNLQMDRHSQIALAYEDQVLIDGKWTTSPIPRGLSGGTIIKVVGTDLINPKKKNQNFKQLLSAITIEHRKKTTGTPGVLIGTRINIHLGLIYQHLPELRNELIIS